MANLLRMPEIAANTAEAVLADWPLPENAAYSAGDAIATVETEKAVVDVPAESDGVLLRRLIEPGRSVAVGTPLAVLGEPGEAVADLDALIAELTGEAGTLSAGARPAGRIFASPLARRTAKEHGLAIEDLRGSGPGGRIVRDDVRRALAGRPATAIAAALPGAVSAVSGIVPTAVPSIDRSVTAVPAAVSVAGWSATGAPAGALAPASPLSDATTARPASGAAAGPAKPVDAISPSPSGSAAATSAGVTHRTGDYVEVPHTRMRRAIATRLAEGARETPVFSIRGTARVDALLRLRAELNEASPVKISVNDLIVAAAARAHGAVPEMNVVWMPEVVRRFAEVDIGVAVATDNGLVVPVIRDVRRLAVSALAATSAELVARARAGRLRQEELDGGTLTVTNLGGFGAEEFAAVINPPQAAILAVGAARQEAVVDHGELAVATVVHVTLSVDHRPVDGVTAARWMAAVLGLLEAPLAIVI